MEEKILNRCKELIQLGSNYLQKIKYYDGIPEYWFDDTLIGTLQAWLSSSLNLIYLSTRKDSQFQQECKRIMEDKNLRGGIPYYSMQKMSGLLVSLQSEMENGLLQEIETIVVSLTFDNFLDHSVDFHKAGKIIESSILVSVVFEHTIRKISNLNGINDSGKSLEMLIDELTKVGIITGVKAKRIKGYSAVRNKALHAQWKEIDLRDIGEMIRGTKELIETKL